MDLAHGAVAPEDVWTSWTFDPIVVVGLLAAGALYAHGVRRLWAEGSRRGVRGRQVTAFYAALLLVAAALLSPLEGLASTLVSGHMAQHLLLLIPAPVLLVYAAPALVVSAAIPAGIRRAASRWARGSRGDRRWPARATAFLSGAFVAVTLHVVAMWVWHLPAPYEAAVTDEWLHALEHATFLGTALLFWALLVQPRPRRRIGHPIAILSAFVLWTLSGGLGALLSFSAQPLYPSLAHHASAWGLSPLGDQQLAGVVMWVPAGFTYLVAMAVLFVRWMDSLERRMRRARAAEVPR